MDGIYWAWDRPVAGSCEHSNESLDSIKQEILE
jgi:hypothetical protein